MDEKVAIALAVEDPIYVVPYWLGVLHLRPSDVACAMLNAVDNMYFVSIISRGGDVICPPMTNSAYSKKMYELRETLVRFAHDPTQFKLSDVPTHEYERAKRLMRPWTYSGHVVCKVITHDNFRTFKRSTSCCGWEKLTIRLAWVSDVVLYEDVWDLDAVEASLREWVAQVAQP